MTTKNPNDQKAGALPTWAESADQMFKLWGLNNKPGASPFPSPFGAFQTPGMTPPFQPTMSVEELDRRIADMRSVERWLEMNVYMLKSTIQTLEVQRNTLAALESIGGQMMGAMKGAASAADAKGASSATPHGLDPSAWWNMLQTQFQTIANSVLKAPVEAAEEIKQASTAEAVKKTAAKKPTKEG